MNYTQEMNLVSKSGYCMPFEEKKGEVNLTLGYGKQIHPVTQEEFFHHGVDFATHRYILTAVADGVVSGIGSTPTHGLYQVIRYGKYEVTYAHLVNALAPFGARVRAGSVVSISGDLLHIEVKYDGEEINPMEFLAMLYGNLLAMRQQGHPDMPELETMEMDIPTDYDDDREEIEVLMLRFYPEYLLEVGNGGYRVPEHTEQSLRNIFSLSAVKNYFYEMMPSLANPLGIGSRSMPIAAKVQNLLIGDFLNYLALRHEIFLSTLSENDKKKRQTKP
ncbi:M23 family metallopeptidase [Bacteroides caccae]|uniref:M23 family metallopeptidase n=1 Tax=Bacteroides caccae TaxID=47678 RepID=UPI0035698602